jgi:hypothetical protein
LLVYADVNVLASTMSIYLGRQHVWALGPRVSESADYGRVLESSGSEFIEEGIVEERRDSSITTTEKQYTQGRCGAG